MQYLWVTIRAEAGAAWVLEKELIAGLRYVDPNELIDVIRRHQVHCLEAQKQVESLIKKFVPISEPSSQELSGKWIDPIDGDTVYFRQMANRVVGFYDYGTGNKKVGLYRGLLNNSEFEYYWKWLEDDLQGKGHMSLSEDRKNLSGTWWYAENPNESEKVQYRCVSDDMPNWLTEEDFQNHRRFLKTGKL